MQIFRVEKFREEKAEISHGKKTVLWTLSLGLELGGEEYREAEGSAHEAETSREGTFPRAWWSGHLPSPNRARAICSGSDHQVQVGLAAASASH